MILRGSFVKDVRYLAEYAGPLSLTDSQGILCGPEPTGGVSPGVLLGVESREVSADVEWVIPHGEVSPDAPRLHGEAAGGSSVVIDCNAMQCNATVYYAMLCYAVGVRDDGRG